MKPRPSRKAASPIDLLAETLIALPDEAERDRLLKNLDAIVAFFSGLKRRVESLPSLSERTRTLAALEDIVQFLNRSKNNPVLSAALGLAYDRQLQRSSRAAPASSRSAEALLEAMKALPTDEIQRRLNDYKSITMNDLHALARMLGIRYGDRMKRQDLIDRIVKIGFANIRGYDLLRGSDRS